MSHMVQRRIVVVGGTGLIGTAVCSALRARGHEVLAVSRSTTPAIDVETDEGVVGYFAELGRVDAVITAFGSAPFRPLSQLGSEGIASALAGKAMEQIRVILGAIPFVSDGGSLTVTSGVLAREPVRAGTASAAANGALEAFVRGAAAELPRGLRLNAVSPTVLAEGSALDLFPGFAPVSAVAVAHSYVRAVENIDNGSVLIPA